MIFLRLHSVIVINVSDRRRYQVYRFVSLSWTRSPAVNFTIFLSLHQFMTFINTFNCVTKIFQFQWWKEKNSLKYFPSEFPSAILFKISHRKFLLRYLLEIFSHGKCTRKLAVQFSTSPDTMKLKFSYRFKKKAASSKTTRTRQLGNSFAASVTPGKVFNIKRIALRKFRAFHRPENVGGVEEEKITI